MARCISKEDERQEEIRRTLMRDPNSWDMWVPVNNLPPGITRPRGRQIANLHWLRIIGDERRRGNKRMARSHLELIERISRREGVRPSNRKDG